MKQLLARLIATTPVAAVATTIALTSALMATAALAAMPMPIPPQIEATAWYLIDARTGTVLTEKSADVRVPSASLTKMMTTYVADHALAEKRIRMGDMVQISEKAWKQEGSRMFAQVGTQVSVEDLFRGIVIQSGNDASVALAEHIGGSEEQFVSMMNQYAEKLGMTNTHYMNVTGLPDPQHYTSAHDLATLSRAIIDEFPENYRFYSEKEFAYGGITQPNRNLLLFRDPSVDGLKTGHTEEAGYCLVASAKRNDTRLISVVMGTASEEARANESAKLINWGFTAFETWTPYVADTVLGTSPVWMGQENTVSLGVPTDVALTIPRGTHDQLQATIVVKPNLQAPLKKGDVVGSLVIRNGDHVVVDTPLTAMADVAQGNIFKQFWHWLRLFFSGLLA